MPSPTHSVNEINSAATTLLASAASSKKSSLEDGQRYADVELKRWNKARKRRRSSENMNSYTSDDEEDIDSIGEHDRLLADDTVDLNHSRQTADTIPDDGEPPPPTTIPAAGDEKARPVSWKSLPRKGQLAILTLARLSEPITQTSLNSYMFYQLKSFKNADGESPSDSTVASQAGLLAAAFTGAQFCTAIMWGRLADWEGLGRKRVILFGLLGTAVGSLGFGFSQSFAVAMFWRAFGGILNGNIGVMRTMISEIVKEKKYLSRAFLLLPMTFNLGVIIGPLLGGLLADPVGTYPGIFGPGGSLGGKDGVWFFTHWPYALPNMVNATFLTFSALAVVFGLEETLEGVRGRNDYGLRIRKWIARAVFKRKQRSEYSVFLDQDEDRDVETNTSGNETPRPKQKLPFRRIWTRNVLLTFLSHGLLAMHVGTFNNLWFVFLSTPRYNPEHTAHTGANSTETVHLPEGYHPHPPFTFTGGLALPPPAIGTALAILGVIGISLQLLLYPRLSFVLGTLKSYRMALLLFPLSYFLVPYLATIPSILPAPYQSSGFLVWMGITIVLAIQVLARTFALPSTAILVNNASPHPSVLGTIHGIAQSVSSATRTIGPVVVMWIYGIGLEKGVVGTAWWAMAGLSVIGAFAGRWVKEGDGHEIWLPGEKEAADEAEARDQAQRNKRWPHN